jgi:phosphoglycolate phosphatase-like HAD superfamily hydrolase
LSANGTPHRLILWDVDHTLITAWDFHKKLYRDAFTEMTGNPPVRLIDMSGRPDRASTAEMLEVNGLEPTEDRMERFSSCLAWAMDQNRDHLRQAGRQAPGAALVLRALADRPDVAQTVVTGNVRYLAEAKLATLGLGDYIDFSIGGYGWDASERWQLVKVAKERAAAKYGVQFSETNTVVLGDTPKDVDAALRGGAAIIAVATGLTDTAGLEAAGAHLVLPNLEDVDRVVSAIEDVTGAVGSLG